MAEQSIEWPYDGDPGVNFHDKANVWTMRDGRCVETLEQFMVMLEETAALTDSDLDES